MWIYSWCQCPSCMHRRLHWLEKKVWKALSDGPYLSFLAQQMHAIHQNVRHCCLSGTLLAESQIYLLLSAASLRRRGNGGTLDLCHRDNKSARRLMQSGGLETRRVSISALIATDVSTTVLVAVMFSWRGKWALIRSDWAWSWCGTSMFSEIDL